MAAPQDNAEKIPRGFTLRHTLRGHTDKISRIAWSPDGKKLASPSYDGTIRIWDVQTGQLIHTLEGHSNGVMAVAWSPAGNVLASSSFDNSIRLWNVQTGQCVQILKEHTNTVNAVACSPDGSTLASGSDDETIRLWDMQTGQNTQTIQVSYIDSLAWSPDGKLLASGGYKGVKLWNARTDNDIRSFEGVEGSAWAVAWSPDGKILASGHHNQIISIWNPSTGQRTNILEGHTGSILSVSFSWDGLLLTSKSPDGTVRLWRTADWTTVSILEESTTNFYPSVAFHPHAHTLATMGEQDTIIRIWDLDVGTILGSPLAASSIHYTSAKIALIGDSGVGKSALGFRIAEDNFQLTESTHGQKFWVVEKLGTKRKDGTQCEAVLWDFAGQPGFRPIHALFLEDIDLALVLFDPSRQDTFTGVDFWLKQVALNRQPCRIVLVAARSDVSNISISRAELEAFCREHNISGGFIATSAKTGEGVDALLEIIRQQIDWNAKPTTVTTETFKRIKDFVLALKAQPDRQNVLVSPAQLRSLLEASDPDWRFSDSEMMTAVGHLQNHGYVTILRRSSDEQTILLAPDLLINLAASFMHEAQANEKGLGALDESKALRNEYRFRELEPLSADERDVLLNAVTELFLARNLCFRESVDNQTYLIFPSLILEQPPRLTGEAKLVEDTTYIVSGQVENVYAALVVLLGYSPSFQRVNQWSKQAQYETTHGHICGFKMVSGNSNELELALYYDNGTPDYIRARFQGLFEEVLYMHNVQVSKYLPVFCPKCKRQQERSTVIRRIQAGYDFLFCEHDGKKINLPRITERVALTRADRAAVERDETLSKMRTTYETALVRVKGFTRDRGDTRAPTCFVSYAWGTPEQERWVLRLTDDLRKADISALLDQLDNAAIGASLPRFAGQIEQSDFIVVVGTPDYRQKYENKLSRYGTMVAAEVDLINVRLTGTEEQKATVLPVLLAGEERLSFPPLLHRRVYGNFTRDELYFVTLFDLVLTLYHIPFDEPMVRDMRAKLREEAQAFAGKYA